MCILRCCHLNLFSLRHLLLHPLTYWIYLSQDVALVVLVVASLCAYSYFSTIWKLFQRMNVPCVTQCQQYRANIWWKTGLGHVLMIGLRKYLKELCQVVLLHGERPLLPHHLPFWAKVHDLDFSRLKGEGLPIWALQVACCWSSGPGKGQSSQSSSYALWGPCRMTASWQCSHLVSWRTEQLGLLEYQPAAFCCWTMRVSEVRQLCACIFSVCFGASGKPIFQKL